MREAAAASAGGAGWTPLISIFAALGFGTIVAALITRWNAVSQLRQAWVNDLRLDIADFFSAVEALEVASANRLTHSEKYGECRAKALYVQRRVLLRLNLRERSHRDLSRDLSAMLVGGARREGVLGSGLVDHSQKMTVAARAMAEKKTVGQRS